MVTFQWQTQAESLRQAFLASTPNLGHCTKILESLNKPLLESGLLMSDVSTSSTHDLVLARDVLEMGALHSLRIQDFSGFERYISQLHYFYFDYRESFPRSERMYVLLGLELLHLLSSERLSEFHTALERIEPEILDNNPHIRYPVHLEQCLMEGSYHQVLTARKVAPSSECLLFVDSLLNTVRHAVANSAERAYPSISVREALKLLFFTSVDELYAFIQNTKRTATWKLSADTLTFLPTQDRYEAFKKVPADEFVNQLLGYAREMEKIV